MDLNKYTVFLEVARQKNISRAAEALGYTQSGVSHILKRLEDELSLTLFSRTKTGVYITNAGRELLPYVTELVQSGTNLDQAVNSLHSLSSGQLTIGTYSSISRRWLPSIIRRFMEDYPSVTIHFKEGGNEEILEWVTRREVDFGFVSGDWRGDNEWIHLREDPLYAILPPDMPFEGDAYPLAAFNGSVFIISEQGIDVDIHSTLSRYDIAPDVRYSAKDDYTIISMVAHGLGVSILPALVVEKSPDNVRTFPLEPYAARELGIALPSLETASPAARRFIDYAREYVASV